MTRKRNKRVLELSEALWIYMELAQYPILADEIRARMRHELFSRGIISLDDFEREVTEKAILSQKREGLADPIAQEPGEIWKRRLARVREQLTDSYFAHNLPHDLLEKIVKYVLDLGAPHKDVVLTFNPELAPQDILFAQAEKYERLPPVEKAQVQHHLEEIKVVLIKSLVSEHLPFVSRAKHFLTISDLQEISQRCVGRGKIGGKAAGMMLAWRALQRPDAGDTMDLQQHVVIPESYFIGSDMYYEFKAVNALVDFMDQKYKMKEEIEADYPRIQRLYKGASLPREVVQGLRALLQEVGNHPLILRSSSLLEDNFGTSFAGKYKSVFCPNQGALEQNLRTLIDVITQIYASVLSPHALMYRRHQGLTDYDERMAILIQKVQGQPYRQYFFPTLAGVAFGRNPFRWTQRIRREDGLVRMVWGLGTRAVDRVDSDYPRMVALSEPGLRPEKQAWQIHLYSQHLIDLIDLQDNSFKTLPVSKVIDDDYPHTPQLFSLNEGDWIRPLSGLAAGFQPQDAVLTFDRLLSKTDFVPMMNAVLKKLERQLRYVPEIEFTVDMLPGSPRPHLLFHILQCRPLSSNEWAQVPPIPKDIPSKDRIFSASRLVPQGHVTDIRYIVYVDPWRYGQIPDYARRTELARVIGRLNSRLEGQRFVLIGPGRWGSANPDLGVQVTYADIYNASVLVEIAVDTLGAKPEASYGTHFFQDLVEACIYPLALYPEEEDALFNRAFFELAPNVLSTLLPADAQHADYIKVIDVKAISDGRSLEIVMNGEREEALAFLSRRA
ncbi:MAG: hypothetical protein FJ026_05925 [Chloroflexi bacterium]|nr:hypothetical protein [Chloroflexota bacterium]